MKKIFTNSPTPEITAWKKVSEETKLAGKYGLSLISQEFVNPLTEETEEYVFCRKAIGITIVPVLSNGNIMITRTFKHGKNAIFWEFPAGMNMSGKETPLQMAQVELAEESGLHSGKVIYLGSTSTGPRKFDTVEHLYLALDCEILPGGPSPSKGEILEVFELTPEELWGIIRQGDGSFSGFSELAIQRAADKGYIRRP